MDSVKLWESVERPLNKITLYAGVLPHFVSSVGCDCTKNSAYFRSVSVRDCPKIQGSAKTYRSGSASLPELCNTRIQRANKRETAGEV